MTSTTVQPKADKYDVPVLPDVSDLSDVLRKANEADEPIRKVIKRAMAVKPGTADAMDKLVQITSEFASLASGINPASLSESAAALDTFARSARKVSTAHTRYRTEIIAAWLHAFPKGEPRGMRSALARALFAVPEDSTPSKGMLNSVKRDIDALRVVRAAADAHKDDATVPVPTVEQARAAVVNQSPAAIAEVVERASKGLSLKPEPDEATPVPVKASDAITRLERAIDALKRVADATPEQRKVLAVLLSDGERALKSIPDTPATPAE